MNALGQDILKNKKVVKRKTLLFKIISMMLPLLVLVLIEVSLHIAGYGSNFDLFIEYPGDKNFLVFNPDASRKYFTNQALATTGNTELFKKKKDVHTLRIFVLGESTTIGYPYFHNGSFHRWLQYRLMHTFPHKRFEIINLSLTAVNSYTVLGFAKDLVPYKPDVVLIYTGHNEYYGTLGVASTENVSNSRLLVDLILGLRELRLVQWMTNVYAKINSATNHDSGTRMKLMVEKEMIFYNSELYNNGIEQFRFNMDKTLSILNKNGIPVFVSNVVSNEGDMKPFISEPLDSIRYRVFNSYYSQGVEALEKNDSALAYGLLKQADKEYSEHALCNYYLGHLARRDKDIATAKKYFSTSKDLDALRFRAPTSINETIDKLCQTYPHAYRVDTKSAFERHSRDHIIGDDLMLEHVHPNLKGYAILSDTFYEAMKTEKIFNLAYEKEMTFDQLLASMPITSMDSLSGVYKASLLKRNWPFNEALHNDAIEIETREGKLAWQLATKKIEWAEAMDSLYNYYVAHHSWANAEKVVEAMVLEHPTDYAYSERAAMLNGKLGDHAKAITYFEKAFDLVPTFDRARYLFILYLKLDKPFEALPYINYGIDHNESTFDLKRLKEQVEEIVRLQETLKADTMDLNVINHIADAYLKMDYADGASKYVNKVLRIDKRNKEALLLGSYIDRKQSNQ